jgi:hypothetical protein
MKPRVRNVEQASAQPLARVPKLATLAVIAVAIGVALAAISLVFKIRYLAKLEPPAQYNHPYNGQVVERVMPEAEVRVLCTSRGASGPFSLRMGERRRLLHCLTER